jgi:branched-chain amino acid transport system permease protein
MSDVAAPPALGKPLLYQLGVMAVLGIAAAAMPWVASSYAMTLVYYMAYYLVLGQAWNLMSGFTGYVSFAHGALAGIGAYTAVIALNGNVPVVAALVCSALAPMLASLVIGITSVRLRGIAFTFATLFFQELALLVFRKLPFAGGPGGLVLQEIFPTWLPHLLMVILATTATIAVLLLRRSRLGIRLLAIKGDESAAAAVGIDATRLKLVLFCISAGIAGLGGGIHAVLASSLYPDVVFSVDLSLVALAVPLIGGVATGMGPLVGAALYVGLREVLQILAPGLHLVIVGLLILLVVLYLRDGVAPAFARILRRRLLAKSEGRAS